MNSRVTLNLVARWIEYAVCMVIGIFLMPYLLHILGEDVYGIWLAINAVAGWGGFMMLGFGTTISRYTAKYEAVGDWPSLNRLISAVLVIFIGMGTVAFAIGAGFAWAAPELYDWGRVSILEVRLVLLVMGLNVAVALIGGVYGGVLSGIQRHDLAGGVTSLGWILRFVLTLAFLQSEWGLLITALINLSLTLTENIGYVLLAYRSAPKLSVRLLGNDYSVLNDCRSFMGFALLEDMANRLIYATDTIVIFLILGPGAVVPYAFASRIAHDARLPIMYIGMVSMPRAGQLAAQKDLVSIQYLLARGVGLAFLLSGGFLIGGSFFGGMVIETWTRVSYPISHILLIVLLLGQLVAIPLSITRSILIGMGHARVPALINCAEGFANFALSLILIKPFGLVGVALGTLIPTVCIELGVLLPYASRHLQISYRTLLRDSLVPCLLPLAALTAYCFVIWESCGYVTGWLPIGAITAGGGLVVVLTAFGGDCLRIARRMFERPIDEPSELATTEVQP